MKTMAGAGREKMSHRRLERCLVLLLGIGVAFYTAVTMRIHQMSTHDMSSFTPSRKTRRRQDVVTVKEVMKKMPKSRAYPRAIIHEFAATGKVKTNVTILSPVSAFSQGTSKKGKEEQEYTTALTFWNAEALEDILAEKEELEHGDNCVPMHDWQTSFFPSCNSVHEIDNYPDPITGNFHFINCGSARCTFIIRGETNREPLVMKRQRFGRDLDFSGAKADGVAMERLSASPYIASIYGYCGTSQLTEYSEGGNIHDRIKEARLVAKGKRIDFEPFGNHTNRAKIGFQVISAVADIHGFEKDGRTSLVHQDVCCHQFMMIDGIYKLGDFHFGIYLKKQYDTGETCLERGTGHPKLRAPEEYRARELKEAQDLVPADVFMAGNVLYYLLTDQYLFPELSNPQAHAALMKGQRTEIPPEIVERNDPYDKILIDAIAMCWTHNPTKRPSAREIADYMKEQLAIAEGVDDIGVVRVDLPPLPSDHRYTDHDFYQNFWK